MADGELDSSAHLLLALGTGGGAARAAGQKHVQAGGLPRCPPSREWDSDSGESDRTASTAGSGSDDERMHVLDAEIATRAAAPSRLGFGLGGYAVGCVRVEPERVDLGRLASAGIFLGGRGGGGSRKRRRTSSGTGSPLAKMRIEAVGEPPLSPPPSSPPPSSLPPPQRLPPPEPAKLRCPCCCGDVITSRDSAAGEGRRRQTAVNRFAQYLPRSEVRKENRLAAWYAKYGYSGPPYCKACAESFNSHLLKQAVRSSRAKCTRDQPCDRCTCILDGFKIQPQELFATVDAQRKSSAKSAAARQRRGGLTAV